MPTKKPSKKVSVDKNNEKQEDHKRKTSDQSSSDDDWQSSINDSQNSSSVTDTLKLLSRHQKTGLCQGNNITQGGKRVELAKMLGLVMIPVITLAGFTGNDLLGTMGSWGRNVKGRDVILFSTEVGGLIHYLQRERDITALYLSNLGPETQMLVTDRYADTDNAIRALSRWPTSQLTTHGFSNKIDFEDYIAKHRQEKASSFRDEVQFYTDAVNIFIDWMYTAIQVSSGGSRWRDLVAYQLLAIAKEDGALERTLGGVFFAFGELDNRDFLWYASRHYVQKGNFRNAQRFSDEVHKLFSEEINKNTLSRSEDILHNIATMRNQILYRNITNGETTLKVAVGSNHHGKS